MREYTIKVHEIAVDGLPPRDDDNDSSLADDLIGRVAFIWDGAIVSGWPAGVHDGEPTWEASDDRLGRGYAGVTHWIELPVAAWNLE